jgi:PKD repeat protein
VASCADVSGPVAETNINTGDGDSTAGGDGPILAFVYHVPPLLISSVRLTAGGAAGRAAGGEQVTILGSQINANTRIQFGDQVATVVGTVPGGVIVISPPFLGTFPTQSCTDISGTLTGTQSVNAAVDIKATNVVSTCTDTSTKGFLYAPPNPACIFPPPTPTPTPNPPVAAFSFFRVGNAGSTQVQFTDSSTAGSGTISSWQWDARNDGTIDSNAQNPIINFGVAGTYAVRLKVTNSFGLTNEVVKQVVVPVP